MLESVLKASCLPLSVLLVLPALLLLLLGPPADAAHDFTVYRMQQYELGGQPYGEPIPPQTCPLPPSHLCLPPTWAYPPQTCPSPHLGLPPLRPIPPLPPHHGGRLSHSADTLIAKFFLTLRPSRSSRSLRPLRRRALFAEPRALSRLFFSRLKKDTYRGLSLTSPASGFSGRLRNAERRVGAGDVIRVVGRVWFAERFSPSSRLSGIFGAR